MPIVPIDLLIIEAQLILQIPNFALEVKLTRFLNWNSVYKNNPYTQLAELLLDFL